MATPAITGAPVNSTRASTGPTAFRAGPQSDSVASTSSAASIAERGAELVERRNQRRVDGEVHDERDREQEPDEQTWAQGTRRSATP